MFEEFVSFSKKVFNTGELIPLHAPVFNGNEKKYVNNAIDSTFVSSVGEYVNQFEQEICKYTGAKYAVATVNGTAALHMAMILAGVKAGDYVLTQALSFIATCNAISYIGAEPIFIDIDVNNLSLSANKLQTFLEKETFVKDSECFLKADGKRISCCVPMHTFGLAAEIDQIVTICSANSIPVVEDAAESIGTFFKGKHTGTFGLLGTISFNGNKTITCGGGGIIITNDEELGKMAKYLTTQAKLPHRWNFVHDHIGYNYRLPNLNAALACAQLESIEFFIEKKRILHELYKQFFSGKTAILVSESKDTRSNYWLNALLLSDKAERDDFLKYTNDNQVMTRPTWELMNNLLMFKNCISDDLTNSREISDRLVNIPSSVIL